MYNRVILMGRLTRDPELRMTQSGISYCRFAVAVDRGYAKEGQERQADFIEVVAWRGTADFVSKYFSKGKMIHVEGKMQNNNYEDQNGVKHYTYVVVADNVTFCGGKSESGSGGEVSAPPASQPQRNQQNAGHSQQPQQQTQPSVQDSDFGDLGAFEAILSDGEVPF